MDTLQLLAKITNKLAIKYFTYRILKFLLNANTPSKRSNRFDLRNIYNELNAFSPDPKTSCICNNHIAQKKQWDLQIIVPVYNVELYIKECIESLIKQQTKYKYQIIIVNDGSLDKSRKILCQYEGRDNVLIIDQENKGFSGARNRALENIDAHYIMFVDSDDKLNQNAIEILMDKAFSINADIVEGGYHYFTGDKITKTRQSLYEDNNPRHLHGTPWAKVYKSNLFKSIHFPEKYWFEDTLNNIIIFPQITKTTIVSDIVYYYRVHPQGISQKSKGAAKTLDTYYITCSLLNDRIKMGYPHTKLLYENVILQIYINARRINTLNNPQIERAIFYLTASFIKDYFKDLKQYVNIGNYQIDEMAKALQKQNFIAYKLAYLFL